MTFRAMVVAPMAAVWVVFGALTACGGTESSSASGGSASGGDAAATGGSSANGGSTGTTGGQSGNSGGATTSGGQGNNSGGATASGGTSATGGSTSSESFPSGFGAPEAFVPQLTRPVRLGFKNGFLYFTEMGLADGTQSRLARRGPSGMVETLFSGKTVVALFLDDDELFFVERGTHSVFRMKYATLKPELFATVPETVTVADVNRVGETVWMTEFTSGPLSTGIATQARNGGTFQDSVPVTARTFIFTYMQVAAGQVYIATQGTGAGLFKGSATGVITLSVPNIATNRLTADANFVYFGSQDDGRVLRQAHSATMSPEVVADGQEGPYAVAVDSGGIYWTNGPDCSPEITVPSGSVRARALAGGAPVTVAAGERCPQAIITDADFVYWIRENPADGVGDDTIMRAKKLR